MKSRIIKILVAADDYVSGQKICEELKVSRTAVWKVMNQLREDGYVIESASNRGYRLLKEPEDSVSGEALESRMETREFGKCIYYREEVDSTNLEARRLAEKGAVHGSLIVAGKQSTGKGRRGRSWASPPGGSIYMSLLMRPEMQPAHVSGLTLVAALAVLRGIREVTGLPAKIKWPNDIVVRGRKVCGILTEMSTEADYIRYVVTGIGINVNIEKFPEEIQDVASSLFMELGERVDRRELICCIMREMETLYEIFLRSENLSELKEEYDTFLVNRDTEVKLLDGRTDRVGVALGIDPDGGLLVRIGNEVEKIVAGEVSVRGLYGYT